MLVQLTVQSKNYKTKTAYTESFESTKIQNLRANQNSSAVPPLSGNSEFVYVNDTGRDDFYTVTEAVAAITGMVGGVGSPLTAGTAHTGWTAQEFGTGVRHRTILTNDSALTQAVAAAALCFGFKCYDFPEGGIRVVGITYTLTVSAPTETGKPEIGLGTVLGDGANATIGASGNDREDIADGTAMTLAITSGGVIETQAKAAEADSAFLDGTATAKDMYLNVALTWTPTETITFDTITISIVWDFIGDV